MNSKTTAWVLSGLLVASASLAGGCARRAHIRADHGEPTRAWFSAQSQATASEEGEGLDSEEAALIHQSYRSVLSRDEGGSAQDESQVLILQEPIHERRPRR